MINSGFAKYSRWIFLIVFAVIPFFAAICFFQYGENYEEPVEIDYFEDLVFSVGGKSGAEDIGCWWSEYEDTEGLYYVFLPSYADVKDLRIANSSSEYVEFSNGEKNYRFAERDTIQRLETDIIYDVLLLGEEGNELASTKMKFICSESLPTIYIDTESGSLDYLQADKDNKELGYMTMYSVEGDLLYTNELKFVSGRGNHTWNEFDKNSYSIKLKDDEDFFGMGADDNWILLSNVMDDSYIRNKITYDMAVEAGMIGSPQSCFVDLYFNGNYYGMYQLSEKVEIDDERVPIKDMEEEKKMLNGENYNANHRFESEGEKKGVFLPNDCVEDITGGYLIERDYGEKYESEICGFITPISGDQYVISSPEFATDREIIYISELFMGLERAVRGDGGIDSETGKSYSDYIDIKSFAQKYLVEEISKNDGGGCTSSYFYKPEDAISNKIFAGPVWDYDKAYGRVKNYDSNTRDLGYLTLHPSNTRLFYYLYHQTEFQEEVKKCYQEFFSDYLQQLCDYKIDEYVDLIEASARMDRIRWEYDVADYEKYGFEEYKKAAEYLKKFLQERKIFLDEVWIEEKPVCTVRFFNEPAWSKTYLGVIAGEKLQSVPSGKADYMTFEGWFDPDTMEPIDEGFVVTKDIEAVGVWKEKERVE